MTLSGVNDSLPFALADEAELFARDPFGIIDPVPRFLQFSKVSYFCTELAVRRPGSALRRILQHKGIPLPQMEYSFPSSIAIREEWVIDCQWYLLGELHGAYYTT